MVYLVIWKKYFNTSYVTVQPLQILEKHKRDAEFQYILCYGST